MAKRKHKIDISDLVIFAGFSLFSWGVYERYGFALSLMVGGGMLLVFGLFMAFQTGGVSK